MSNTVIGGKTEVTIPEAIVSALQSDHVTVATLGSASAHSDTAGDLAVDFPITGGYAGSYDVLLHQDSGVELSDSHGSIEITNLRVNTQTKQVYADVEVSTPSGTVNETDVDVFSIGSGSSLALTAAASMAIDAALSVNLPAGTVLGTADVMPINNPLPASVEALGIVQDLFRPFAHGPGDEPIVGGHTDVTLTSASVLSSLGLHVSGLGSAHLSKGANPVADFSITGGTETPSGDVILHQGSGLEISNHSTKVDLTNFVVDTIHDVVDADVSVNGSAIGELPVFNLAANGTLTLTTAAATALDSTFGLGTTLSSATVVGAASTHPFALPHAEASLLSAAATHGGHMG